MWVFPSYYGLALLCVIGPAISWFTVSRKRKFQQVIVNFFIIYIFIISSALIFDEFIDWKMLSADLNNDGVIDKHEVNDDVRKYYYLQLNDAGRNFAYITGFIFSLLHSLLFFVFLRLVCFIRKKKKK